MSRKQVSVEVKLDRFVSGGQAIGSLEDGKKVFVWGGLPGETVIASIRKSKRSYCEGVVQEVINKSQHRVEPPDKESYLSTSPWQILDYSYELSQKSNLIKEAFEQNGINIDPPSIYSDGIEYEYRNKMEFSFWWDTESQRLSLAFFRRGTHGKMPVGSSSIASETITSASKKTVDILNSTQIEARELKTLLVRSTRDKKAYCQLYLKDEKNYERIKEKILENEKLFYNFEIIFSNPKSPASVITKRLFKLNSNELSDSILENNFQYAPDGFFQVNLPIYEEAIKDISRFIERSEEVLDLYSGVGSIGLSLNAKRLTLVESDDSSIKYAKLNAARAKGEVDVIHARSEEALNYIREGATLVIDPPRAGLHKDVSDKIIQSPPRRIVYLSCNPTTQARDIKTLEETYKIEYVKGYNFFPRTPHIESLVVLTKKAS